MTDDPLIERTEEKGGRIKQAANLFDLRRIIGGLFVAYGLLLAILGLFDSQEEIDKAQGVNINLWGGLGMLVLGILFLVWAFTRPLSEDLADAAEGDRTGPVGAPPPRGVDAAALGGSQQRGGGTRRDREDAGRRRGDRP
jgi:hypothetical protein